MNLMAVHHQLLKTVGSNEEQRKKGFFVKTIKDWDDLPPDILNLDDYETSIKTCRLIALRDL
jgi:hypothetical protein